MEKLYQVRIYYCDDEEIVWENLSGSCDFVGDRETDSWEYKTLQQAEKVFEEYKNNKMEEGETIVITETPALSEDECEEQGFQYYIEGIKIFSK